MGLPLQFWRLTDDRRAMLRLSQDSSDIQILNRRPPIQSVALRGRFRLKNYATRVFCDASWSKANIANFQLRRQPSLQAVVVKPKLHSGSRC
ncbi:hypothetical protein IQ266_21410 [filamentous cyanobacterium LEGE 11480]|uniref:Uncharacterized protein n=1 Tax=Romeriopsis navalis LEGE 11480 TaxID=2777977 RepID=A0A928Z6J9_9CYAN|nr:hypothetical protein [Romeriopsis navalis]MBE9032300.1 hypothetical protein [Romeriopsis navalis LEGE 11480]